ncbi:hypothetical protein G6F70_000034 [Rhizopus microsporus]|nr:hypothetical protein G6F71_001368 [Rhizopus microsporus]KAG1204897.1 hypothetical protein G6F70_000034 [Rhizopus microsporus]KAG1216493.1 hypothetical protein G6F69_000064 [Rhizopus microsporus]KAG1238743.1 hypothetical protein G6F67_000218 [Rhizopus microsporus]KAG1269128.1 hypothetical protein G6F68_000541 [Rhizopus microsporus]
MKFMEDGGQKSRILQNYDKWRKSKETKNCWTQREQERQEDDQNNQSSLVPTSSSVLTSSSSSTRRESIETINLDEAKDLILPRLLLCDMTSMKDPLDITTSFAHCQAHVFKTLTPTSLLTFETHLQHLLAMSNILIVDFRITQQKLPYDIMRDITSIVNDINCGLLPKLDAVDDILFKWMNEACFNDADNDLQDRPDGCIENDNLTIGYLELKLIDKAKEHKKINTDLYRLDVFSKAVITKYKLKHIFQEQTSNCGSYLPPLSLPPIRLRMWL